jgi:hypothetical protein
MSPATSRSSTVVPTPSGGPTNGTDYFLLVVIVLIGIIVVLIVLVIVVLVTLLKSRSR